MAAWDKDCDIVFLATPNSVTGQLIPKTEIESIARVALTRKSFVVIDEAFIDFVETESVKTLVRAKSLSNRVALAYKVLLPCRDFGSAICSAKPAESRSSRLIRNPGPSTARP